MSWSDGPRAELELKFPSMLRTLEQRASVDDRADAERAARMKELRRQEEARAERAREARVDPARVERLVAEVAAWRRSTDIRAYIAVVERELPRLDDEEQERVAE